MARDHISERGRNTKIYYPRVCLGLCKRKKKQWKNERWIRSSVQQIKCVKLTFVCNVLCCSVYGFMANAWRYWTQTCICLKCSGLFVCLYALGLWTELAEMLPKQKSHVTHMIKMFIKRSRRTSSFALSWLFSITCLQNKNEQAKQRGVHLHQTRSVHKKVLYTRTSFALDFWYAQQQQQQAARWFIVKLISRHRIEIHTNTRI